VSNDRSTNDAETGSFFHRVVAAILVNDDRILFVHRASNREWAPNTWDVPGGHIEPGEDEIAAVRREVHEELSVDIATTPLVRFAELRGATWEVAFFRIDAWSGEVSNAAPHEHSGVSWMTPAEVSGLPLADPAILPILRSALR
jgi:8-oxo-dGTP pyrophosphatase MutT (NUDIX family)